MVPEVYMMVDISSPSRTGLPANGWVPAMILSHCSVPGGSSPWVGPSGMAMQCMPLGTPDCMPFQPSSLPMNSNLDSLWVRIWRIVSAASVGYSGTETPPASQIA